MAYRIVDQQDQELHLRRERRGIVFPLVGSFIGLSMLGMGISAFIAFGADEYALIFTAAGLVFSIVPWVIAMALATRLPEEVEIDRRAAVIRLISRRIKFRCQAEIGFDEVREVIVQTQDVAQQQDSAFAFFDICIILSDYSILPIFNNVRTRERADELRDTLSKMLRSHRSEITKHSSALTTQFQRIENRDSVEYVWHRTTAPLVYALMLFALSLFVISRLVDFGSSGFESDMSLVITRSIGVVIGALVLFSGGRFYARRSSTMLGIRIGASTVELFKRKREKETLLKSLPLSEVADVGFGPQNFDDQLSLEVLSYESMKSLEENSHFSLELSEWKSNLANALKMMQTRFEIPSLELPAASAVEHVVLLQYIRRELNRKRSEDTTSTDNLKFDAQMPEYSPTERIQYAAPRILASLGIVFTLMPLLLWFMTLPLQTRFSLSSMIWLFRANNLIQIAIAMLSVVQMYRQSSLRPWAMILGLVSVLYTFVLYGLTSLGDIGIGFMYFVLSICMLVSAVQMLRMRSGEDPLETLRQF